MRQKKIEDHGKSTLKNPSKTEDLKCVGDNSFQWNSVIFFFWHLIYQKKIFLFPTNFNFFLFIQWKSFHEFSFLSFKENRRKKNNKNHGEIQLLHLH
jgi:hypothetical protein